MSKEFKFIPRTYQDVIDEVYGVNKKEMYKKGDKVKFQYTEKDLIGEVMKYIDEEKMYEIKCEEKIYKVLLKDMEMMKKMNEATRASIYMGNMIRKKLMECEDEFTLIYSKLGNEIGVEKIEDFRDICDECVNRIEEFVEDITMVKDR